MALISIWLENRQYLEQLDEITLRCYHKEIFDAFGGFKSMLKCCLQHKYIMDYIAQCNLSGAFKKVQQHVQQNVNQHIKQEDFAMSNRAEEKVNDGNAFCNDDLSLLSLKRDCIYHLHEFLERKDLTNLAMASHLSQKIIFNPRDNYFLPPSNAIISFGTHFIGLNSNDKTENCRELVDISKQMDKYGSKYIDQIYFTKMTRTIIEFAKETLDGNCFINGSKEDIAKQSCINILWNLIKHDYFKPECQEIVEICTLLMDKIFDKKKDCRMIYGSLILFDIVLKCNADEIGENTEFMKSAACKMEVLLRNYLDIITKYEESLSISFRSLKINSTSNKQLQSIPTKLSGHVAYQPLIIANIMQKLRIYSKITMNTQIVGNVCNTLNIDNFSFHPTKPIDSTYKFKKSFLLKLIQCDLNLLNDNTITKQLNFFKPQDIDYLFWLITISNNVNKKEILQRFLSLMHDIKDFAENVNLTRYPSMGINAYIELLNTKYEEIIAIPKITETIDLDLRNQKSNKLLQYTLNKTNLLKYLETKTNETRFKLLKKIKEWMNIRNINNESICKAISEYNNLVKLFKIYHISQNKI